MPQQKDKSWVYAIESESTGRIYIGHTNSIGTRITRHNSSGVFSTKHNRPWKLICLQVFETKSQAMYKEREIKQSLGKRLRWIEHNRLQKEDLASLRLVERNRSGK